MKKRIRILQVIDSLRTGGAEKIVYDLATHLDGEKYEVSVCSMEDERDTFLAGKLDEERIRLHFPGRKEGFDPSLVGKIRDIIRNESIDIVHCHVGGELYGHAAAVRTRASVITTLHGIFHYSLKQKALIKYCGLFKNNHKIAVSEELMSLYKCDLLIYNGTPLLPDLSSQTVDDIQLHVKDDLITVAIIGRLSEVKNHFNFLDAAAAIIRETDIVRFLIVGDGPLQSELERYAAEVGVASRTDFAGYRKDMDEVLKGVDISALSSDSEGLPMVVLESMAAGIPVVSTQVGGIPELVIDGITGILVPPRDSGALASAILRLVKDKALRKEMGIESRKRVESLFSTDTMVEKYCSVYDKLVL
ncbi:MAG: glycosyltransferase [Candidatus Krumholzibacteriota bacterium]|nr:glycosyltransferase [Candidatus Krumholzibacteriota bacterium]